LNTQCKSTVSLLLTEKPLDLANAGDDFMQSLYGKFWRSIKIQQTVHFLLDIRELGPDEPLKLWRCVNHVCYRFNGSLQRHVCLR